MNCLNCYNLRSSSIVFYIRVLWVMQWLITRENKRKLSNNSHWNQNKFRAFHENWFFLSQTEFHDYFHYLGLKHLSFYSGPFRWLRFGQNAFARIQYISRTSLYNFLIQLDPAFPGSHFRALVLLGPSFRVLVYRLSHVVVKRLYKIAASNLSFRQVYCLPCLHQKS